MASNDKKYIQKKYAGYVALLAISVVGFIFSPLVGFLFIFTMLIVFLILGIIDFENKKNAHNYRIIEFGADLDKINIPTNMPFPYAVFNSENKLLVCNKAFNDIFSEKVYDKKLKDIFPETNFVNEDKTKIALNNKYYYIYSSVCETLDTMPSEGNSITSVSLIDITDTYNLEKKVENQKPVISLVFIDNYREVLENIEDDSVPLLTALIDRKLNDLASDAEGVIKKLEKDRYLFITTVRGLNKLKESRFEILNAIKDINIGNHAAITISFGIGICDNTIESAMKNAKAAIDLALGRGGDQAVIKNGEHYTFFGGKSGEVSPNSRIRARVKSEALSEIISESDCILVMGHRTPDLDSFGSALGICRIATALKKPAYIIANTISPGITRLYDRLKEFDEYTNMIISSENALELCTPKTTVIVVDTHKPSLTEYEDILHQQAKIVVIDHHRKSTEFIENTVLTYHEPYASSTSELVTEMIQHMGEKVKLKPVEADALMGGITVDTKHFTMQTGAITFETSAYLKRNGADSVRVRQLFQNDMAAYKAKATAVKDAEVYNDNIAISVCPSNLGNAQLTAAQAADELLNIIGIKASFVLSQIGDTIYCSGRSLGYINVQIILEKLGGGGHQNVSGGQFKNTTIEQAIDKLKKAIDEYMQED